MYQIFRLSDGCNQRFLLYDWELTNDNTLPFSNFFNKRSLVFLITNDCRFLVSQVALHLELVVLSANLRRFVWPLSESLKLQSFSLSEKLFSKLNFVELRYFAKTTFFSQLLHDETIYFCCGLPLPLNFVSFLFLRFFCYDFLFYPCSDFDCFVWIRFGFSFFFKPILFL